MSSYAELHCKTNYSFLEGASHADELAAAASQHGYGKTLAIIALIVFLSAILITSLSPERCGVRFGVKS